MFYYVLSSVALIIIGVTMLVRANDLGLRRGKKWFVRRIGFILAGCVPLPMIINEWYTQDFPTVYETVFRVGVALVFMTTPYMPPWWKWIAGVGDHPHDRRKYS